MTEAFATVRITVLGEDTCPQNWWLCCPPPPPEPIPERPTGFVPLDQYDLAFTYPLKSSRKLFKDSFWDGCITCGPGMPSPAPTPDPDPDPEPEPGPEPSFCWLAGEGSLIISVPEEFNKDHPIQVYDPFYDSCYSIKYSDYEGYWTENYNDTGGCDEYIYIEEGLTYIFSQDDIAFEMVAGPGTGIIINNYGNNEGYLWDQGVIDKPSSGVIQITIENVLYEGEYDVDSMISWFNQPPLIPGSFPHEFLVEVWGDNDGTEMMPFCGALIYNPA